MTQESRLAITIDSRGAQREAKSLTDRLNAMEAAGYKVDPAIRKMSQSMDQMASKASGAGSKLKGLEGQAGSFALVASRLAAPLAAAFGAAKFAMAAEQFTNLTNRLRLVTDGTEQLAYAQQSVYDVAQNSRQSLDTTAQVYQRVAQNARQLGLNFADVASVTETVAKTVALSGASTQAADAAMVQFGQALASGTLRGDELNSILEQTPALAQAIARGLGVTIGQLRTMGAEGKLTSEAVVQALQNQKDKVDQLSSAMKMTVSQSMTAFNNAVIAMAGRLDEASGASSRLATGISSLTRALEGFSTGEFFDFFRTDKQTIAGLNNELGVTIAGIRDLQNARSRLDKSDPGDTVLFKFQLYDRKEIDAEIANLERKAGSIRSIVAEMRSPGQQKPPGEDAAAPVNAEYEKLLANLKKAAALQGQNSEAARVRYAIETGELGKLLPEQEKLLLQYAQEKDAKEAAEAAAKKLGAANAKANADASKGLPEAIGLFSRLYGQYDPAAQAVRSLTMEQQQLQLALDKGAISQIEYSKAIAQASLNYASIVQGQDQHLLRLKQINDEYVKGQSLAELYAQAAAATGIQGPAGKIAQAGIDASINSQIFSGKPNTSQIDAVIGGAGSELMRMSQENEQLQAWYDQRIAMYQQYRELEVENAAQYDETIRQLEKQRAADTLNNERSMSVARLSLAEGMFGDLTSIVGTFAGQQSGAYKAMFAVQKAASIAQSLVSIQTGIAMAAANPFPLNLAAMATVAASTASIVGNIQSVGLNLATGGYVRGPGTATSDSIPANLSNGEFVVNAAATRRNRQLLEAINSNERVSVYSRSSAPAGAQRSGQAGIAPQVKHEVYIVNNSNAVVETRTGEDGRLEVLIQEVENRLADQLATGWGTFTQSLEQSYVMKRNAG